ncbi:MAG: hypothetical protein QXJ18_02195 [Desulfurococcaceae archaeon]
MSLTHVGKLQLPGVFNTCKLNVFQRRLAGVHELKACTSIALLLVVILLAVSAMVLTE